jgi:hypothetical protein
MGKIAATIKAVKCPMRNEYAPVEVCRKCDGNMGYAFAVHEHSIFGVICRHSTDGYEPDKVPVIHHTEYAPEKSWQ